MTSTVERRAWAARKILSDPAVRAAIRANHDVARLLRAERATTARVTTKV